MLIGSDDKVWFENYLNSVDSDLPLSPALSPHAGKGSQTRLPSPSLPAGRDLGWGKVFIYLAPRWWLVAGVLVIVGIKGAWLDPSTTIFRRASTCEAVQGADAQTD